MKTTTILRPKKNDNFLRANQTPKAFVSKVTEPETLDSIVSFLKFKKKNTFFYLGDNFKKKYHLQPFQIQKSSTHLYKKNIFSTFWVQSQKFLVYNQILKIQNFVSVENARRRCCGASVARVGQLYPKPKPILLGRKK